ncbi:hypothetical protein JCM21900_005361 [Sporobolomyces salmonicolor]
MGFSNVLSVLGGVSMAVGPPLAYADQYVNICRTHSSAGFSTDISGLLIVANVSASLPSTSTFRPALTGVVTARCIYWLGDRFQVYLLVQSLLMIGAQFGLLYVCLIYRPSSWYENRKLRPGQLWQWDNFGAYLEFTALLILLHCAVFLLLGRINAYVQLLGFLALGLEATLPIPQLLVNYEHKSTAGFRHTVLAGWLLGDGFKSVYYFVTPDNGLAFKACAVFQLSVDILLCIQTWLYRKKTAQDLADQASLRQHQGVAGAESLLSTAEGNDEHEGPV